MVCDARCPVHDISPLLPISRRNDFAIALDDRPYRMIFDLFRDKINFFPIISVINCNFRVSGLHLVTLFSVNDVKKTYGVLFPILATFAYS